MILLPEAKYFSVLNIACPLMTNYIKKKKEVGLGSYMELDASE